MSGETQAAGDLVHLLTGGGGAVGGAGTVLLLQRLLGNNGNNGCTRDMEKIASTSSKNTETLEQINAGIQQLNVTMARLEGALSRRNH